MKRLLLSNLILISIATATTLKVPSQYSTIQAAIDVSSNGDTVLVQPGTYVENINYNGKNIVVGSLILTTGDTSYISQTVIDGDSSDSVVTFKGGENSAAKLNGFTITNGYSNSGGGIFFYNSSPSIFNTKIIGNASGNDGGGIYCSNSNPIFLNVTISNNTALVHGGGIHCQLNSNIILKNVTISNNSASGAGGEAGGIFCYNSDPLLINVTISGNTSKLFGGGIVCYDNANPTLVNSILWSNSPDQLYMHSTSISKASSVSASHSDIEDGVDSITTSHTNDQINWLEGNIDSDPFFVNSDNGDFNLQSSSPCINAGTPFLVVGTDTLVDLSPNEYLGSAPDMGAYEFGAVSIIEKPLTLPEKITLHQNYPNPFNPTTTILYDLPEASTVHLVIYDVLGRQVRTLINQDLTAGYHKAVWDATDDLGRPLSGGLYIYRIQAGEFTQTRKMLLLK